VHIELKFRGLTPTNELRAHVSRRLEFALDRFTDDLRRVSVLIADVNGPRGGVDKRCRIELVSSRCGTIVVHRESGDVFSAVDETSDLARRTLSRELSAARSHRRVRLSDLRFA
jgi:putative sigma-54 modulation protein